MAKQTLSENPDVASFCAAAFIKLGGTFTIGSNGVRYAGRPEPVLFRIKGEPLPQLPDARPHEQFHNADEWRGALKLLDWVLSRISVADADLIYGAFASDAATANRDFRDLID